MSGTSRSRRSATSSRLGEPSPSSRDAAVLCDDGFRRDDKRASSCGVPAPIAETTIAVREGTKRQRQDGEIADPGRPATAGHGVHVKYIPGTNALPFGHTPYHMRRIARAQLLVLLTGRWRDLHRRAKAEP
jgi:hypothetical protein